MPVRPSQENLRQIGQFATLYRWYLEFTSPPSGVTLPDGEALNFQCESADLPKITGEKTTAGIRGHEVHQPGQYKYSDSIGLTFFETTDNIISQMIADWKAACWEPVTGKQKPKSSVEAVVKLTRLDSEDNPIWEYTLYGCWPMDSEPGGQLVGSAGDPMKPVLTLAYDYFKEQAVS